MAEKGKEQPGPAGFQIVGEGEEDAEAAGQRAPRMTFGTFVPSLSASALVHLGEAPSPESGKAEPPNLPLAEQTIEMLEMLAEKTRGNLDEEEAQLLESLLHDLRMRYVRARGEARG